VGINPAHQTIVTGSDGQPYSLYPVGTALFALPFVMIADALAPDLGLLLQQEPLVSVELEALTVSFWCAVATAMMFRLATETTRSVNVGLAAAFIFAFCSPILSTASRGLWSHGPVVVCVLTTLLLLRAADRRPNLVIWAAISVALAFLCRPLAAPLVMAVTVFVAIYHTRHFAPFVLVGTGIAILWAMYNYAIWDHVLPPYYRPGYYSSAPTSWLDSILGSVVSPSRGLLIFSPVFLASLLGVMLKLRNRVLDKFDALCIAVILGHVGLVATSPVWWAGQSYGPRFMTDVIPLLVYLILPVLQATAEPQSGRWRQIGAVALLFLSAFSFLINVQGALMYGPYLWNTKPSDVDRPENYDRLWAWHDLQFLRGTALEHGHPSFQLITRLTVPQAPPLAPGSEIDMSITGNWGGTLISGWSAPETGGVWTNAVEAHLRLPLRADAVNDLTLDFNAHAFVTANHPSVTVTVVTGDETVETWHFNTQAPSGNRSLTIPKQLLSGEVLDVAFRIDTPKSPSSLGISEDGRLLGLGLSKIRVVQ
jgi:hypothetical protein